MRKGKSGARDENPSEIARERIFILLDLAKSEASENPGRAKSFVALARKLGMRHSIKLGEKRTLFCGNCLIPLVPGKTASFRVGKGGRLYSKCLSCGNTKARKIGLKKAPKKP